MGVDLIKWRGGDDDMQDLVKRARNLLDTKEQAGGESKSLVVRSAPRRVSSPDMDGWQARRSAGLPSRRALPQDLELPRDCTVYDREMWLARYELDNGVYHYAKSIELTAQQRIRYGPENVIALPSVFRAQAERCACCGAWTADDTTGAIWCAVHNGGAGACVCWGRSPRSDYYICSDSCGGRGQLDIGPTDRIAVVPGRMRGNY